MRVIVLAEYKIFKIAVSVHYRQRIQLVIPYNIVGLFESGFLFAYYKGGERGHKIAYERILGHTAHPVITACDYTEQLAVRLSVGSYRNGGVSVFGFKLQNIF